MIDERLLRRLNSVIRKRIAEQSSGSTVRYVVRLADHSLYETQDLEEVLHDENLELRKIEAIELNARTPVAPFSVAPGESPEQQTSGVEARLDEMLRGADPTITVKLCPQDLAYSIKGPSRDWVFNSQSDIIDQLKSLIRADYYLPDIYPIPGIVFGCLVFILVATVTRNRFDREQSKTATPASRTSLRTYIGRVSDPFWSPTHRIAVVMASMVGGGALVSQGYLRLMKHLFPSAIFAIGEQLTYYQELVGIRNAILWGALRSLKAGLRAGRTIGGGFGFGLLGAAIAQSSRYVGTAFGYYGMAWSLYSTLIARGAEVQFGKNAMVDIR